MPGKPRKSPSQLDHIQKDVSRLNKRVDGLALELKTSQQENRQEFRVVHKKVDGLARELKTSQQENKQEFKIVRQEFTEGFKALREEMAQGQQALREEIAQGQQSLRQEMAQGFERQGLALEKQITALAQQIAEGERKNEQFRSDMMSAVDFVLKKHDDFRLEKTALGAGQDRLQKEVAQLKESDSRQNEVLHELDSRVTRLEAA